jgi:hypothetical protein
LPVTIVWVACVVWFVITTVTPGTALPCASRMTPLIRPSAALADGRTDRTNAVARAAIARSRRRRETMQPPQFKVLARLKMASYESDYYGGVTPLSRQG